MAVITVIMSMYNEKPEGIKRAVDSILNQTFKDFEYIIIIDDPNNKEGIELIKKYHSIDSRIKYFIHDKNIGLHAGLNEGIRMAEGKYIAQQDTEDISNPKRLQVQYEYMEKHPEVDILGTSLKYIDPETNLSFYINFKPIVGDEIRRRNPIAQATALIKKESFFKNGFFLTNVNEYELWVIWYLKGAVFHNLQESYYDYFQTHSEKIRKVKKYLINDTNCKRKYAKALKFKFGDYLYLYAELITSRLPSFFIIFLLYIFYKIFRPKQSVDSK